LVKEVKEFAEKLSYIPEFYNDIEVVKLNIREAGIYTGVVILQV